MKVLHSGSLDVLSGGPALSTLLTIRGLINSGVDASIIMSALGKDGKLIADDISISYTKAPIIPRLGYISNCKDVLESIEDVGLYHIQGIWQLLGHSVAKHARSRNIPYIVTLRGMLYPQALQKSRLIKKISLELYQRKDLDNAACIQATCIEEKDYYRDLGFRNPVAVIPNPIETNGVIERPVSSPDKIRIGYLGRVHPRKRIERLINAVSVLNSEYSNIELLIIGSGDIEYEKALRNQVENLGLKNVVFTGFLTGAEKDKAIMSLSYLCVPSDFENFGNIVTEALVRGVPVIASKGTPWRVLEEMNCGWWIDNDTDSIIKTLHQALSQSEDSRLRMGYNGKKLISENFEVDVLGNKMRHLYEWVLGKGEKPDFVYTD